MGLPNRGTIGTLGGFPLMGTSANRWVMQYGVKPSMETFDIRSGDAEQLMALGKVPVTLTIDLDGQKPLNVTNLWVLHRAPGENAYVSRITVADRRWFWSYGFISARYNFRRTIGSNLLTAGSNGQLALNQVGPLFSYANWSLRTVYGKLANGQYLSPGEVLADTLARAMETEYLYVGSGNLSTTISIDPRIGTDSGISGLPIEDLWINDPADMGVARALAIGAPEGQLTVTLDGTIKVSSMAFGDEAKIVTDLLGPRIQGRGWIERITNERIRPSAVEVYFVREHELRFDFNEVTAAIAASGTTVANTPDPLGEQRVMENVIPVTDYTLTLAAQDGGKVVVQGTWITVDQAMRAWGNMPGLGVQLDHSFLQQAGVPDMDLWAALQIAGAYKDFNTNWAARINAMQTHYRRTYRINPHWRDRLLGIRAYRVATIDVTRGTRGHAMAYGDFAFTCSQRSLYMNYSQGGGIGANSKYNWAVNASGYPSGGAGANLDSTSYPSPARVSVLDSDQGIIHVDYVQDANKLYEDILPSNVVVGSMPQQDMRQRTNPLTWDSVTDSNNPPRLSSAYNLLVILTGIPACPNGLGQYFKVTVKASDLGITSAIGPTQRIFIGPGIETARFGWSDIDKKMIDNSFGVSDGSSSSGVDIAESDLSAQLQKLCTNYDGDTGSAASISRIARAAAKRIYASQVDRFEGSASGMLNPDIWPMGWANVVIHELDPKGIATTRVQMQDKIPQYDIRSMLPQSDRAAIGHLVVKQ